jgi:hypothetical protein
VELYLLHNLSKKQESKGHGRRLRDNFQILEIGRLELASRSAMPSAGGQQKMIKLIFYIIKI